MQSLPDFIDGNRFDIFLESNEFDQLRLWGLVTT